MGTSGARAPLVALPHLRDTSISSIHASALQRAELEHASALGAAKRAGATVEASSPRRAGQRFGVS
jgi:hypothetical protein